MSYASEVLADGPFTAGFVGRGSSGAFGVDSSSNGCVLARGDGVGVATLSGSGRGMIANFGGNPVYAPTTLPGTLRDGPTTVSFWYEHPSGGAKGMIAAIIAPTTGWAIGVGGSGSWATVGNNLGLLRQGIALSSMKSGLSAGTHHLMLTRSGTTWNFYVDGVSTFSGTLSVTNSATQRIDLIGDGAGHDLPGTPIHHVAWYSGVLSAARATAHYNAGTPNDAAVLADGPETYWKGDELAPGFEEATSTGKALALAGALPTEVAGPSPAYPALRFPNTASHVIGTVQAQPTTATYEVWLKVSAFPAADTFIMASGGLTGTAGNTSALALLSNGKMQMSVWTGSSQNAVSASAISLNEWHHIVGSVGAAGTKLRIDKVTVGTNAATAAQSLVTGNVYVRNGGPISLGGTGVVDLAAPAMWRSQLTDARSDAHYDAMGPYSSLVLAESTLAGYWRLGDPTSPTAAWPAHDPATSGGTLIPTGGTVNLRDAPIAGTLSSRIPNATQGVNIGTFNDLTIEMWVKIPSTTTSGILANCRNDAASVVSMTLGLGPAPVGGGGAGRLWFGCDGPSIIISWTSNAAINDNAWHHVAAVWDGTSGAGIAPSQMTLYIDGAVAAGGAGTLVGSRAAPVGGATPYTQIGNVGGSISRVALYKAPVSSTRIAAHYAARTSASAYDAAIATDTPSSYWTMDETLTPTYLSDSSPLGHSGVYNNAGGITRQVTGLLVGDTDKAVSFNGAASNNGKVTGDNTWMSAASFTAECVIKPTTLTSGGSVLFGRYQPSHADWFLSVYDTGRVSLATWNGSGFVYASSADGAVANGRTSHIAATFTSGGATRLYVDGVLVGSAYLARSVLGTPDLWFGCDGTGDYYNGVLDECAFYSSALSPTAIGTHAAAAAGTTYTAPVARGYASEVLADSPLGYYRMNSVAGSTLVDSSGLGHDGTWVQAMTTTTGLLDGDTDLAITCNGSQLPAAVNKAAWNDVSTITLEAIILPNFNASMAIWNRDPNTGNRVFQMNRNTGGVFDFIFWTPTGGPFFVTSASNLLPVGVRAHVAVTYDGTTARTYINGIQTASLVQSGGLTTTPVANYQIGWGAGGSAAWSGVLDEFALYGTALSPARIVAHAAAVSFVGGGLGLSGSGTLSPTGSLISGGAVELGLSGSGSLSGVGVPAGRGGPGLSGSGQLSGVGVPAGGISVGFSGVGTLGPVTVYAFSGSLFLSGVGRLSGPVQVHQGVSQRARTSVSGDGDAVTALGLTILDDTVDSAPSIVAVAIQGAIPGEQVFFTITAPAITTYAYADADGAVMIATIPLSPTFVAGDYTITATQVGRAPDSAVFHILNAPAIGPVAPGANADPVDVAGAIRPNGTRRWILQDLAPGGVGSWILPYNPKAMDNPAFERGVAVRRSLQGAVFLYETGAVPLDWGFSGTLWSQLEADKLHAYGNLGRRFWLIDHRARAWLVSFVSVEVTPKLTKPDINGVVSDWTADYEVKALILSPDQEPIQI